MAAKPNKSTKKNGFNHKHKKKKGDPPIWEPAADDAINLAALRIYFLTMERLALLIYRSDPTPDRPRFGPLSDLLADMVKSLKKFAKQEKKKKLNEDKGCPGGDERCEDKLCHPPGECSD